MGKTTLKTFALHYKIRYVGVAKLVKRKTKDVYFLPFNNLCDSTNNYILPQLLDVKRKKRIEKKPAKISKSKFDLNSY